MLISLNLVGVMYTNQMDSKGFNVNKKEKIKDKENTCRVI